MKLVIKSTEFEIHSCPVTCIIQSIVLVGIAVVPNRVSIGVSGGSKLVLAGKIVDDFAH